MSTKMEGKTIPKLRKAPKTGAERIRAYRARIKALESTASENSDGPESMTLSSQDQEVDDQKMLIEIDVHEKMPLLLEALTTKRTATQMTKLGKRSKIAKTGAERARAYRQRKKAMKKAARQLAVDATGPRVVDVASNLGTATDCVGHIEPKNSASSNRSPNNMEDRVKGTAPQIRLKPSCIPTKFQCQDAKISSSRKRPSSKKSRTMTHPESLDVSKGNSANQSIGDNSDANQMRTPSCGFQMDTNNKNSEVVVKMEDIEIKKEIQENENEGRVGEDWGYENGLPFSIPTVAVKEEFREDVVISGKATAHEELVISALDKVEITNVKSEVPDWDITTSDKSEDTHNQHTTECITQLVTKDIDVPETEVLVKEHILVHCTLTGNYECTKCSNNFSNIQAYLTHFVDHSYHVLTCPHCLMVLPNIMVFVIHIDTKIIQNYVLENLDLPEEYYKCKMCSRLVVKSECFQHWEGHLVLKPVQEVEESGKGMVFRALDPDTLKAVIDSTMEISPNPEEYSNAVTVQVDVHHRHCSQFSASFATTSDVSSIQPGYPKTAAERMREYRARKKKETLTVKHQKQKKSAAQRAREYRIRKKMKIHSGDSSYGNIAKS